MGRQIRPILIHLFLLYHILLVLARASPFPVSLSGLAQFCDDLWSQRNPSGSVCSRTNTFERSSVAPIRDGRDIHLEQFSSSERRVASIASLPTRTEARPFGTVECDVISRTNPLHFAR